MISRLLAVCAVTGIMLVACGGSNNGDLYGKNGSGGQSASGGYSGTTSGGGSTAGGSGGSGGTTQGGGGTQAGGAGGTPSGGDGGTTAGGAGGAPGGGGAPLGGAGGSLGGGGGAGGSGGSSSYEVKCGDSTCTGPTEACCVQWVNNSWQSNCIGSSDICYGSAVHCDGPEDCGTGDVCCGTISNYNGFDYYSSLKCTPASSCQQNNNRVTCGATASSCPSGTSCVNSYLLPGYNFCA